MRRVFFAFMLFAVAFSDAVCADNLGSIRASMKLPDSHQEQIYSAIRHQLKLPENKIDVGIAALTFAKEFYPDLGIQAYSKKIDALADEVRQLANGSTDPEIRIRAMNTVIYRKEGFHYDHSPFARARQENYLLNGILDTKMGICYTMPLLYIAVAQRVGYPIYPVEVPDHIFVRYKDPSFARQNIETTSGGKYFEDEFYIEDFAANTRGIKSGAYLRTKSYREFLGMMVSASAVIVSRTNGLRGLKMTEMSLQLNPKCALCYDDLNRGLLGLSKVTRNDDEAEHYLELSKQYGLKAKQLGYVDQSETKMYKKLRGQ